MTRVLEALVARGYALTYDAIVTGFPPYEALLDDIAAYISRAGSGPLSVLDVSCGTGTVARRLARDGHRVVGVDPVAHLVHAARRRAPPGCRFYHLDIAREAAPGSGKFDVVVSAQTLYWHPDPVAIAEACRRSLRPGGHALVLTYSRRARVVQTFQEVRAREDLRAAFHALRWLVPTALFEGLRDFEPRYLSAAGLEALLRDAGFRVLEIRPAFLAELALLAWAESADVPRPSVS